jgi:hypothetical protein
MGYGWTNGTKEGKETNAGQGEPKHDYQGKSTTNRRLS